MPHGIDTNKFRPENPKLSLDSTDKLTDESTEGRFVFVSVFEFQHRKNPEALLRAYWEEFTSKDNTALVIKTYWGRRKSRVIVDKVLEY